MKKIYFSLTVILLQSLSLSFAQCNTCTTTWNGTSNNVNVSSGTYCFTSGTFTGTISGLAAGATICVGPNAIFKPANLNNLNGTLNLYGEAELPGINPGNGFLLNSFKKVTFTSYMNFNDPNVTFINQDQGYMLFPNSFQLGNQCKIINYGAMQMNGDFNMTTTAMMNNRGQLRLNGNFNPSGTVTNDGLVVAKAVININSGSNVTNNCKFVSVKGFNNNAYFKNNGLVWVTSANEGESHIQNNGGATIEMGPVSTLRGMQFTNGGTVKGSGKCYFTMTTRQQGTFAGTSPSSPMNFYDASSSGQIFDYPTSNQSYSNTIRSFFVPADTLTFNCSAFLLPLTLTGFDAQVITGKTVLLAWQTHNEVNTKTFIVERSDKPNGNSWQLAGNIAAAGNTTTVRSYQLTDKAPITGVSYYRLRAVDVDGKETISSVKQVNLKEIASIKVYPNLVEKGGWVKVISDQALQFQLLDMSGKVLTAGSFQPGVSTLPVNVNAGNYILETIGQDNKRQHHKIIVQ